MGRNTNAIKKILPMSQIKGIVSRFNQQRLGSQLTVLLVGSLLFMVFSVSIVTAFLFSRSLSQDYIQNGKSIAALFAEKSALPVLGGSEEVIRQAIDVILPFPDVEQLAIYDLQHELLAQSKGGWQWRKVLSYEALIINEPVLEYDGRDTWQFLSPVYADLGEPNLEDAEASYQKMEVIGFVRILISKRQLQETTYRVIMGNVFFLLLFSVALIFIVKLFSDRLTHPLESLVKVMSSGATKQARLQADLRGSIETVKLGESFNRLMLELEAREGELESARDRALDAARLKSEFAANVSHEIRTPLNGIMGTLNLLAGTSLDANQKELIRLAETSSDSLMLLINDILDYSRLSLGDAEIINQEFDLRQMLEDIIQLHAKDRQASGLDLLLNYDASLSNIVGSDANKIRQLCNNFVHNAVKFTDQGSVTISVRREAYREEKTWICISVTDTGIGIKQEELKSIFLPYSQSDGSATRRYGGTGLGLSISEKIAELLQGDIGVNSKPGVGSEFYTRFAVSERGAGYREHMKNMPIFGHNLIIYAGSDAIMACCESLALSCGLSIRSVCSKQDLVGLQEKTDRPTYALVYPSITSPEACNVKNAFEILDGSEVPVIYVGKKSNIPSQKTVGDVQCLGSPVRRADFISSLAVWSTSLVSLDDADKLPTETGYVNAYAGVHVLVVEDNLVNQRLAKLMLERFSITVTVASHGVEAVDFAKVQRFDLILMDCQMPVMNGFDSTQHIRKSSDLNRLTPIIAMTANSDPQDQMLCYQSGMNAVLAKPFKLTNFAEMLSNWLS